MKSIRDPDSPPPDALERVFSALATSDLGMRLGRVGDADVLAASGLALAEMGPLADALSKVSSHSKVAYRAALVVVHKETRRQNLIRNWRLRRSAQVRVAEVALAHYARPACPHCQGRGKMVAEGTPFLSGNICKHCHGTGERPVQRRYHDEITHMIHLMNGVMTAFGGKVARRLW